MDENWRQVAIDNYKNRGKPRLIEFLVKDLGYDSVSELDSTIVALPCKDGETQWFIYLDETGQFRLLHFSHVRHWTSPTANISLQFTDKVSFEHAVVAGTMEVYQSSIPARVWRDLRHLYGDFWKSICDYHATVCRKDARAG
jgi:hypothetical protein